MNKKLISNEFKSALKPFIVWTVIISVLITLIISINPLLFNHSDSIIKLFNNLPKKVQNILYINVDTFKDPIGYYALLIDYLLIIASISASMISFKVILNDKINGYNEFLFTKPISKSKIFINKIICIGLLILMQNIIFNILSITLTTIIIKNISILKLFQINSSIFLLELTIGAISIFTSSFIKNTKHIYKTPCLTILILYIVAIPERIFNIFILRYINPFSYFKVSDIILNNHYEYSFIIASLIIILFSLRIAIINYEESEIIENKPKLYKKI